MGGFPGTHKLFMGMPGMHGTVAANLAITNSDLIIAIGCRFDDRVTGKIQEFAPKAKVIHIDIDPTSISKNIRVDIPIVGDVKSVLREMIPELGNKDDRSEWLARVEHDKKKNPLAYKQSPLGKIKPQHVIEELWRQTKGTAIITTEVGQNQMWAAQFYKYDYPRGFISSGGLGTMGYGFPAAIGAKVGNPDKVVVDIAGDGSIQMNIQELATVASYNIGVKVFILNNGYLGMVRQWQELFYQRRYSGTPLKNPDFIKVAEGYGVKGMRATKENQVEKTVKEALAYDGPVFVDFCIEEEENVFPMVPAGEAINRMIGGMA
jgi:acetolactate synthase-1/2/3 large subunit